MLWHTVGHKSVKSLLDKQLQSKQFNHAYLFIGTRGIGKLALAQEFASRIVGAEDRHLHPDVLLLGELSTGGVEEMRRALSLIGTTPLLGSYKVIIIPNIEQMNAASSNALLKTLEEPPEHSLFLLTANSRQILTTILSRCQVFSLSGLTQEELQTLAQSEKLDFNEDMLTLAHGSIDNLRILANDKKQFIKLQEQLTYLENAARASVYEKILAVQELSELETDELQTLFKLWLWRLQTDLTLKPAVHNTMQVVLEGLGRLSQNLNKKLIIQHVLLNV